MRGIARLKTNETAAAVIDFLWNNQIIFIGVA